ncbi:MAG: ribosomal RNA small subunit methyltransferase A [Nitrospina sp.]|jgi:16S rRNA (adenine1518-N6/adenine1519-N6)-dimethyltransferase|nr:ribosomal RNA small subunit methyltransferase A [Nitrospina sp.]MBT6717251.1 ribosomal RNA small subunit methyltransferase A [Nitrospina sp.]
MRKRPLGQNFLVDSEIAQNIIALANIQPEDDVVEIGPGKGVLTQRLLPITRSLTAIELDPKLCRELETRFQGNSSSFRIIEGDAAKFDYSSIKPGFKVVSNLPYYAATHIMKKLIHFGSQIQSMTLMMQKEVVDRLTAKPGNKEYSSLSVYVQYHCDVERLLEIPNTAFSPRPKIDSSLFSLKPLPQPKVQVQDPQLFFKIVNAAFYHKRKMLKNNLKSWESNFTDKQGQSQLAGIDLSRRGETLSMSDFANMANYLYSPNE